MNNEVKKWLLAKNIAEVEAFFPDFSGVHRGKIVPTGKFLQERVRLPESAIAQSITGEWSDSQEDLLNEIDNDMDLRAEPDGCFIIPWNANYPAAQIICDCENNGRLIRHAPRTILRRVLRAYRLAGWRPIVAPELEFYLVARDANPDNPLRPPAGRSGNVDTSSQPFGIDAANEFEPVIDDIYQFAEAQDLALDTLSREEGMAQFEINFQHGEPLAMADQVLMFKRCVREAAAKHGIAATFMAKPIEGQPGSSMHLHASVLNRAGENIFADDEPNAALCAFIAGMQNFLAAMAAIYWPSVNAYRRLNVSRSPVNRHWGVNNRTVGFRVPAAEKDAMRVEARVCGADANPYLATAALLWSGLQGLRRRMKPDEMTKGAAWDLPRGVPLTFEEALANLRGARPLRDFFGNRFVDLYAATKHTELQRHKREVTSWERRFLLHTA